MPVSSTAGPDARTRIRGPLPDGAVVDHVDHLDVERRDVRPADDRVAGALHPGPHLPERHHRIARGAPASRGGGGRRAVAAASRMRIRRRSVAAGPARRATMPSATRTSCRPLPLVAAHPLAHRVVRDAVLGADGDPAQLAQVGEQLLVRRPLDLAPPRRSRANASDAVPAALRAVPLRRRSGGRNSTAHVAQHARAAGCAPQCVSQRRGAVRADDPQVLEPVVVVRRR